MSFTTFSVTRQVMKPGESAQGTWPGYSNQPPMAERLLTSYDLASPSTLGSSYSGASGSSYHIIPSSRQPSPRIKSSSATVPRPPLRTHHSYPSLKRSYQAYEQGQYSEIVPELYDVIPDVESQRKPTMHPDHRLLSFGQTQARHTVLDQYGRPGAIDITAQIHGMFFLSEIATNSGETVVIQPELTCYRRNLFQISGSVTSPTGPISVLTEHGQTVPIVSQELSIFATESVDGHVIRLIVIPWKTPPPNSPEVPPNQEQEPPPITLDSNTDGNQEVNNEVTVQTIAWRRLQFRVATANNGRRKELQQHFVLRLNITAILADNSKLCIAEAATAPIVVRGRSPRNFQARKEIPLVGSSASPRGQTAQSSAIDKKVAQLPDKSQVQKAQPTNPPKRPFQYHASNFPPSPQLLREGYNHWTISQGQSESTPAPTTTPTFTPPQGISQGYLQTSQPDSDATRLNALPSSQSQLPVTEGAERPHFYHMTSAPNSSSLSFQFMDTNSHPAEMARHVTPASMSSLPSYSPFEERRPPPYSALRPTIDPGQQSREYFPVTLAPETWRTAESGQVLYGTSAVPTTQEHFTFSSQSLAKEEPLPGNYTWSAA